jgi:hypothetical protein
MSGPRWRAPREDGATLVVPEWEQLPSLIEENQRLVSQSKLVLDGKPLTALRQWANTSALTELEHWYADLGWPAPSLKSPLIVTGHQPELFHPGVWAKNVAVSRVARQLSGSSLNINVDSDVAKSTGMKLPVVGEDAIQQSFSFSSAKAPLPYEEWDCDDEAAFAHFPQIVEHVTTWPWQPVLPKLWQAAIEARSKTKKIPERWIIARHQWEQAHGIDNLELTMSRWCQGAFFRWLVGQFIADRQRFAGIYNSELKAYRTEHRIRSANHPVADLLVTSDLTELPFWAWSVGTTQRGRLCVKESNQQLIALINGKEHIVGQDLAIPTKDFDWKIRPKALITSMMFRLFLADLFVHGIGGAIYDELTDRIFRTFWNVHLPRFAIVTATLRLPWGHPPVTEQEPRRIEDDLRALHWNPDRFLPNDIDEHAQQLSKQKLELIATSTLPEQLHARHQQLETIRTNLQPYVARTKADRQQQLTTALQQLKRDEQHFSREYPWVLYPEELLHSLSF